MHVLFFAALWNAPAAQAVAPARPPAQRRPGVHAPHCWSLSFSSAIPFGHSMGAHLPFFSTVPGAHAPNDTTHLVFALFDATPSCAGQAAHTRWPATAA